jgi:hypothetical protein
MRLEAFRVIKGNKIFLNDELHQFRQNSRVAETMSVSEILEFCLNVMWLMTQEEFIT